jgi:hypothetical protein
MSADKDRRVHKTGSSTLCLTRVSSNWKLYLTHHINPLARSKKKSLSYVSDTSAILANRFLREVCDDEKQNEKLMLIELGPPIILFSLQVSCKFYWVSSPEVYLLIHKGRFNQKQQKTVDSN